MIVRRARPLLGTLVEAGVRTSDREGALAAIGSAFEAVAAVQACCSRFEPASDVARFNALAGVGRLDPIADDTRAVLALAAALRDASDGLFDVTLGSAPFGWALDARGLVKRDARARLNLGGIGKGRAVDRAVAALRAAGVEAGWVNAGGDLRAFGALDVPVMLRDERGDGVRPWLRLGDGAIATSRFGGGARAVLAGRRGSAREAHVSVAAPTCDLADALTKIVAGSGDPAHPLLAAHGARAWLHAEGVPA